MSEASDVPDADRLEQELTIDPVDSPELPDFEDFEAEAPEADAVEQALPAPLDEDDFR